MSGQPLDPSIRRRGDQRAWGWSRPADSEVRNRRVTCGLRDPRVAEMPAAACTRGAHLGTPSIRGFCGVLLFEYELK